MRRTCLHVPHIQTAEVGACTKTVKARVAKICWRVFAVLTSLMLGHFVSYMLMLGHAGEQALRRDSHYRMFHVKRLMLFLCREYFDE